MKLPRHQDRLPRRFYDRSPAVVARQLLGKLLIRKTDGQWLGGRIVETEAYLSSGDPASHSARGKKCSNASMFGPPGTLYVYPIHAKHCMNAVTQQEGTGSAVLIRALEPIWGVEQMMKHRGTDQPRRVSRGPAMLCQALRIDRKMDAIDLVSDDRIMIAAGESSSENITATGRIGISSGTELQLRFFVDGNWFVSGRASDHRIRPASQVSGWQP